MYKFLMVDDEEIVRRGFRRKVDWTSLGFEFLEPCENGKDAIDAIEKLCPDVVMTDIYMPHVDGLAVAEYAATHHPGIIVVILSGYDEFEYAQKAIRTKVFDYVLKPVTSRELTGLVARLRDRLDANRASLQTTTALQERAERGDEHARARSLLDLVTGAGPDQALFTSLFRFSPVGLACTVVVVERGAADSDNEGPGVDLPGSLRAATGTARYVLGFSPGEDRAAVLVLHPEGESDTVAAGIARRAAAALGRKGTVGIGRSYASWVDAPRAYEEACAALAGRLISGPGTAFAYTPPREDDPACIARLKSSAEHLCRAVVAGDSKAVPELAAAYRTALAAAGLSPPRIRHEVEALFTAILDLFSERGVSPASLGEGPDAEYDRCVQRLRASEEVEKLLARLAAHAAAVIDKRTLPVPEGKARDVQEYVARHFGESGLSARTIAASLSISESYLAKLVKRYLNRSLVDYITGVRLERARELLGSTDMMMQDIAEATGYPDARYWSSLFKKHLGCTPSDYRNEHRGKAGRE
jgi:two-component system, response regulator YesN